MLWGNSDAVMGECLHALPARTYGRSCARAPDSRATGNVPAATEESSPIPELNRRADTRGKARNPRATTGVEVGHAWNLPSRQALLPAMRRHRVARASARARSAVLDVPPGIPLSVHVARMCVAGKSAARSGARGGRARPAVDADGLGLAAPALTRTSAALIPAIPDSNCRAG